MVTLLIDGQLNPTVFDHAGLPLSPVFECVTNYTRYGQPGWFPNVDMGECNMFLCHCNHCYGANIFVVFWVFVWCGVVCVSAKRLSASFNISSAPSPPPQKNPWAAPTPSPPPPQKSGYDDNCQGTDDSPGATYYYERFQVKWCIRPTSATPVPDPEYRDCRAEMEPYLKCPAKAAGPAEGKAPPSCADKHILEEAPELLEARLSSKFCEPGGKLVGRAFLEQVLATLDANGDGSVSCAEWGIAKRAAALEQLGGAYRGPQSVAPPECPMTPQGAEALARYNSYLGALSSATT
jgi:hypothetical protein